METTLIYIGKVAIVAGAFYLAFLLLFQNQKHFTFNRIYLPVSLALSFVIPLITFTTIKYIEPVSVSNLDGFAYLPNSTAIVAEPQFVLEWHHYLFGLYILGIAGFLFYLLLGHLKAINIIQKSRIQRIFDNLLNITQKDVHPFSFFSKIVVSEKTLSHPDLEIIVSHENIHVREKHTLDILFTEIMFLFQWFNPFAWLIKDAVKNNLEYLADHEIAKKYNPQTYQLAMVTLADKQGIAPFLTALNGGQLKNRIIMMKKKTESRYSILKQLVVLPLLAVLVMGLAKREVKTEVVQNSNQNEISSSEKIIKGNVTDQKGDPISGASVIAKGTTTGTITDPNGNYELQINNENETLSFLVPDFETVNIDINGQNKIDVQLKSDNSSNNSVVKVTTSGAHNFTLEKEDKYIVSGKVTNEKDEPLSGVSVVDKGKMTGTFTDKKGNYEIRSEGEIETLLFGKDGYEMMEVKTNGRKNIDVKLEVDNKLYIVDGKEFEAETSEIDAENIERIDILKGESGFKFYGEKGKNGVVLITTKSESKDKWAKFSMSDTTQPPRVVKILKSGDEDYSQALYLVDGKEVKNLEDVDPQNVEKVKVLKPDVAVTLYGEKGKNGIVSVTTKDSLQDISNNIAGKPIIIVDGQRYDSMEDANVPTEDIASVSVLKGETASPKIYGERAKDGVIIINTKTKYNSEPVEIITQHKATNKQGDPIFYKVDEKPEFPGGEMALRNFLANEIKYPEIAKQNGIQGKVYVTFIITKKGKVTEPIISRGVDPAIDKEALRVIEMLPDWKPGKQRGEAVNVSYTVPVYFELEKPKHNQTYLDLRRKIAQSIKYPVVAQENNQQGVVDVWAFVAKDGTISNISEKKLEGKIINIDEVVVTSLKSEKAVTSEKSKDLALLVKESKRVIEQLSPLKIPELAGETVSFRIRFVLQ